MVSKIALADDIISQAQAYRGICAGITRLADVLKGLSYRAEQNGSGSTIGLKDAGIVKWLPEANTVLVLGMHHPADDPPLDWWELGDTEGNRHLRKISESLRQWLRKEYGLDSQPLPYHLEKGGLFLKDAAVLSGIGIIGRNNLLLHPAWGPRIRLRSILLEGDPQTTEPLSGFTPCEICEGFCHKACPTGAFPQGSYNRSICSRQMDIDAESKVPDGQVGKNGDRNLVIKYCRACELSCPVGA